MIHNSVIEKVEKFVFELFEEKKENTYSYHNFQHTQSVVEHAKIIGEKCSFSETEMKILIIAAWFHDTGYLFSPLNHEEKSIIITKEFLKKNNLDDKTINKITTCIEATRFPQKPSNIIASALCDADLFHLSENDFFEKSLTLRNEINELYHKNMDLKTYWEITLELFKIHKYFTPYGQSVLSKTKEINYQLLEKKINEEIAKTLTKS
jgi:predicted metal-dependent HD superfamily phosphohydrolase